MNNWCFIDESWHDGKTECVGVLAAVMCPWETHEKLTREVYRVAKKYYGEEHARDHRRELKGSALLGNPSFKMQEKHGFSKNLTIAREVLEFAHREHIKVVVGTVYGDEKPSLLSPDPKKLSMPFRNVCSRLLAALPPKADGLLVFDQRLGAQEDICIAVHNYLAGVEDNDRLRSLPLVAVSNVCAGLQLADLVAFIVGKYSAGDDRFSPWYRLVSRLQIKAKDHQRRPVYGLFRKQWQGADSYIDRSNRTKKEEPGASGKEAS